MSYYYGDPWRTKYTTPVGELHGCEIKLDPTTGKFAAKVGREMIERKDLASIRREITRRAGREPQKAMRKHNDNYLGGAEYDMVEIATEEPTSSGRRYHNGSRYRCVNGELIERQLWQPDEALMAELNALAKERAEAYRKFDDRARELTARLVRFEFKVTPFRAAPEPKAEWTPLGKGRPGPTREEFEAETTAGGGSASPGHPGYRHAITPSGDRITIVDGPPDARSGDSGLGNSEVGQ